MNLELSIFTFKLIIIALSLITIFGIVFAIEKNKFRYFFLISSVPILLLLYVLKTFEYKEIFVGYKTFEILKPTRISKITGHSTLFDGEINSEEFVTTWVIVDNEKGVTEKLDLPSSKVSVHIVKNADKIYLKIPVCNIYNPFIKDINYTTCSNKDFEIIISKKDFIRTNL